MWNNRDSLLAQRMRSSLSKWLKFNRKLHFKSLAVLSVWFNSSPLQPREAHGSLLWPQPASVFSWQHQNIRMDSAYSSVHSLTDTGQRDSTVGCVPLAFSKAPLCFTIRNICFGKVAFNRQTQRQPRGTGWRQTDGLLWFLHWWLVWRYHSFNGLW